MKASVSMNVPYRGKQQPSEVWFFVDEEVRYTSTVCKWVCSPCNVALSNRIRLGDKVPASDGPESNGAVLQGSRMPALKGPASAFKSVIARLTSPQPRSPSCAQPPSKPPQRDFQHPYRPQPQALQFQPSQILLLTSKKAVTSAL